MILGARGMRFALSPGDAPALLEVTDATGEPVALATPICFEATMTDACRRLARVDDGRARWLVNLTNDGWFGISSGPYQHLQQARVRAIEEGLPLVRAANTGISAVIDPLGRIVNSLPLGTEGVLDAPLPRRIRPTIYARAGDGIAALIFLAAIFVVVRNRMRSA